MSQADLETETVVRIARPTLHQVILLNDDYTPMEFVISVITSVFGKSAEDAQKITMLIHEEGRGIVGVYTKEVADAKVADTTKIAQSYGHPLKAITRPAT